MKAVVRLHRDLVNEHQRSRAAMAPHRLRQKRSDRYRVFASHAGAPLRSVGVAQPARATAPCSTSCFIILGHVHFAAARLPPCYVGQAGQRLAEAPLTYAGSQVWVWLFAVEFFKNPGQPTSKVTVQEFESWYIPEEFHFMQTFTTVYLMKRRPLSSDFFDEWKEKQVDMGNQCCNSDVK